MFADKALCVSKEKRNSTEELHVFFCHMMLHCATFPTRVKTKVVIMKDSQDWMRLELQQGVIVPM